MSLPEDAAPAATLQPETVLMCLSALRHMEQGIRPWVESDPTNPDTRDRHAKVVAALKDLTLYRAEVLR